MSKEKTGGISCATVFLIIFLVFFVLKLSGLVEWSWWIVLSPIWIFFLLLGSFFIVFILILLALAVGNMIRSSRMR